MKNNRIIRKAISILLVLCMACTYFIVSGTSAYAAESSIWHNVGNVQISNGSGPPAITTDESGTPFIAYGDGNHSNKAVVKKFDGSSWVVVGTEGFSEGQINYIAIAIDRDGVPFVVFGERDFNDSNSDYKATVMKYDDSKCEWVEVGSTRFTSGGIKFPSIAFDSNSNPYISFAHNNGTAPVATVMKYVDGENGWISVGNAITTARAECVSMAMDNSDVPYVAYQDGTSNSYKATVKKLFNGATWATVGSSTCFTPDVANYTGIVIDKSTNTPYIAYSDYANSRKVTVQKYNGSSWETVGGTGFSAGEARYISLALDSSGNPYVSYQDVANSNMATVMKYNGSNWETVGSPGFSEGATAAYTCLALDSANIPYVIFTDSLSNVKVMNYAPPTYEMAALTDLTFTQLMKGYAAGTQQAAEITVSRTGTGVLTNLAVSLSGADAGNFTVTQPSLTTLDDTTNTSTTFTVKSADGLTPGIYSATVTVTADNMTAVSFSVTQTVTEEAAVSICGTVLYGMDSSELDSTGVSVDNGVYTLDCSKIDGGSGTAVYDSSTGTLTLNSAVIPRTTDSDGHGLNASVGDLILELNGNSTFGIAGDTNTVSDFYVKNGGVTVRDGSGDGTGSLELYGHNSSSNDAAAGFISDGDFNFEDGSYHFIGNGYYSYGLAADSNINITGGSIDVDINSSLNTGTDASYLSAAIMAYGDVNVGGGDLDICVTGAGMGIMASDVNLYDGNIDISVSAEDDDEFGTGIYTGYEFRMEGGTVNIHVTAAAIATAVYGVSPNATVVTITGGTLVAVVNGGVDFGLSYDQVIIRGGLVAVTSTYAICDAVSVTYDDDGTNTILYNTTPAILAASTASGTVSDLSGIIFDSENGYYTDSAGCALTYIKIGTVKPTVTGVTPSGTGAAIDGSVAITFNEVMDTTAGTISLDGGTTALMGGSWSSGNTVYTVPYSGLSYSTPYTVTVSGFKDTAGNVMETDATHGFTTGADTRSSAKAIAEFSIGSYAGTIDETNHTIEVTVPYGTDVTSLSPTITLSTGATVSPASGTAVDFTNAVTYTVTAENETMQAYTVTVTVAAAESAAINPDTGSFDLYSPTDVTVTITWNDATEVSAITANGSSIGTDNYSVSGNTLTIKKEYLATQAAGSLELTIAFDAGNAAMLTVSITDTTPPSISPASRNYDLSNPADVTTAVTWNSAASVTDVVYSVSPDTTLYALDTGNYTVSDDTLTIKNSFFSGLSLTTGAALEFDINFNTGTAAILTVNVVDGYTPSDDADLSNLSVNGTPVSSFDPDDTEYDVELPYGATSATVTATASDPNAQVSITQASSMPGSATVTVTAEDGTTKTYTINFTIGVAPIVAVTNITVTGTGGVSIVQVGNTLQMLADVLPANATDRSVTWSIEDGSGATIDEGGLLTATEEDSVTVRATANDGSGVYGEKDITITAAPPTFVPVTDITGVPTTATAGTPLTLSGTVTPVDATNQTIDWSIQDAGATGAMISGNTLSTTAEGTVTVTATIVNGLTESTDYTKDFTITISAATVTTYTVTASAGSGGSISPSGAVSVTEGNNQTFTIAPGSGYRIRAVTVDGVGQGAITTYTFTNVTANHTINATFTRISNSGGGGGGSSSGGRSTTSSTPTYNANVNAGNGSNSTLSVTVDNTGGNASVNVGSGNNLMFEGKTTVITVPSVPNVDNYTLGIPVPSLSTHDEQGALAFKTNTGTVTVPSNMLTGVEGISGSKAQISIGQGDKTSLPEDVKAAVGVRPLVQLTLSIDGKQKDWNNPDAPVTVSIPYTPTAAELANPESIVIWYIDGSGKAVSVPNGHYDPATGTVTFTTTHFSDYAVGYNKKAYNDVAPSAWYKKTVGFIAARGITSGTGSGNYSPEAKLTRGEFIVLLMRAYNIDPDEDQTDNFADAGSTYYTGYLAAAKRLGITEGIGNNQYAPGKEITRQEMFTLLYNALKVIGQLPEGTEGKALSDFTDAGDIASWAKDAMTLLVETGTVGGSGGKLSPTATTTRAEMAQVLYNLLSK